MSYGRENLGRYVHTLAWLLGQAEGSAGRLLDAGVYPGHLALALARLGQAEVAGLGRFVPPAFREWMGARGIPVDDVDLEREPLPHAAATFDRVLATEILEHLANPGLFLSECWRVLRPGGGLWLTTPNVVDARGRLRAARGRSPQSHLFGIARPFRMNEWVHRREYAPEEIRRMLGEVGFRVTDLHTWTPTAAEGGGSGAAWLAALLNRLPGLGGTIFAAATRPEAPVTPGEIDRARVEPERRDLEARPGTMVSVAVRFTNLGTSTWTPGSGPGSVVAGAHLLDLDGRVLERDLARCPLPAPVDVAGEAVLALAWRAPAEPGVYLIELDLVREGMRWFGDDASPTARVVLRVLPHRPADP